MKRLIGYMNVLTGEFRPVNLDEDDGWIRLMASEIACYEYPDDTAVAKAQRVAFIEGFARGVHGERNFWNACRVRRRSDNHNRLEGLG